MLKALTTMPVEASDRNRWKKLKTWLSSLLNTTAATDSDHQFLPLFSGRVVETDMAEVWRRYIRPLQFPISIQFSQPANTRGLSSLQYANYPK